MTRHLAIVLAALASVCPSATAAITYDATAEYSTSANPNGVWSSGYESTPGSTLILFNANQNYTADLNIWYNTSNVNAGAPDFAKNFGSSPIFGIAPGQIALHPGAGHEYGVLRFTAPSAGVYTLNSQFFSGNSGDTDAYVLLNGDASSPLFYATTTNTNPNFSTTLNLAAGDRLDFAVGDKGDFGGDSTPLTVVLSAQQSVPEPSSWALALIGGLLLGATWPGRKTPGIRWLSTNT